MPVPRLLSAVSACRSSRLRTPKLSREHRVTSGRPRLRILSGVQVPERAYSSSLRHGTTGRLRNCRSGATLFHFLSILAFSLYRLSGGGSFPGNDSQCLSHRIPDQTAHGDAFIRFCLRPTAPTA